MTKEQLEAIFGPSEHSNSRCSTPTSSSCSDIIENSSAESGQTEIKLAKILSELKNTQNKLEAAKTKMGSLQHQINRKDVRLASYKATITGLTNKLSKRKRLNIKIDRENKALVNEKIRLMKEITRLTTATDSTKSTPRKTKKKGEKKARVKSQKSTHSIQPQNVAIPEGFREVKSKKNKKRRTTNHNPVHIQKNNTPAENRNITPDQPNKRNSPVVKITKTTVITDSLGAGLGERLRGKNTCV